MGMPASFTLFKKGGDILEEGLWPFSVDISLGENSLFAYPEERELHSSLSLHEDAGYAVYSLNFPLSALRKKTIRDAHLLFTSIFKAAKGAGECSLIIGSEITEPVPQARLNAVLTALNSSTEVSWVLTQKEDPVKCPAAFSVVDGADALIFQRRDLGEVSFYH